MHTPPCTEFTKWPQSSNSMRQTGETQTKEVKSHEKNKQKIDEQSDRNLGSSSGMDQGSFPFFPMTPLRATAAMSRKLMARVLEASKVSTCLNILNNLNDLYIIAYGIAYGPTWPTRTREAHGDCRSPHLGPLPSHSLRINAANDSATLVGCSKTLMDAKSRAKALLQPHAPQKFLPKVASTASERRLMSQSFRGVANPQAKREGIVLTANCCSNESMIYATNSSYNID